MERESDTSLTSSLVRHGTVREEEERDQHADEEQRRGRGEGIGQRSRSEHRGDVAVAALQERQRNLQGCKILYQAEVN